MEVSIDLLQRSHLCYTAQGEYRMKKFVVSFTVFGILLLLVSISFGQSAKLRLEIETSDDVGLTFKDSVENVAPDTPLFISVYGQSIPAMLGYSVELTYNFSLFDGNNVSIIAGRTGEENPFGDASKFLFIPTTPTSSNEKMKISVVSIDGTTSVTIGDSVWTFLGRFGVTTSSGFNFPGDSHVFSVLDAVYVDQASGNEIQITDHNSAFLNIVTEVEEEPEIRLPTEYKLGNNYPNPFNPSTNIPFELKANGNVKIVVMNLLGQEVAQIVNEFYNAGSHLVTFNARNLSTGVYFYRFEVNGFQSIKKFVLIR